MNSSRTRLVALAAAAFVAFSMVAVDHADARRGGSFGSRGTRTFQSAPSTRTAPQETAPVQRSMTPSQQPSAAQQRPATAQRPAFNGLGGSLMRGLLIGGLFGMLLGYGFGGAAGALGFLLQLLLIGGVVFLLLRLFRSRQQPAYAGAGAAPRSAAGGNPASGFTMPRIGSAVPTTSADFDPTPADLDAFERMLGDLQSAFARQDHAALRRLATPEMVSYLSEELAQNATAGLQNEVSDVKLLQADIAEAWREGDADYATAALQYEARDYMRRVDTGRIADGGTDALTETTELWTFMRARNGDWKVSAIQETAGG